MNQNNGDNHTLMTEFSKFVEYYINKISSDFEYKSIGVVVENIDPLTISDGYYCHKV